ncbi:MAG: hypothetical protein RI988_1168 [Pseudomonadota bacterium]|jgi:hypothetical protein
MAAGAAAATAGGPASPAQGPATASVPAPAAQHARAPATEPATREAEARLRVTEDDHVRVEELRVRGESRHILVQPKAPGARPYEIVPGSGAQDPSQRGRPPAGTSLWRMFSF